MAYITPDDITNRFPEFSGVDSAIITTYIDDTKCNFDVDRWGCLYARGHSLYVAHLMSVYGVSGISAETASDGGGGPVTSQAADGVSRSYAAYTPGSASDSFLMQTKYGQEYLSLRNSVGTGGVAICTHNYHGTQSCNS